jgi:hypothetical protein
VPRHDVADVGVEVGGADGFHRAKA